MKTITIVMYIIMAIIFALTIFVFSRPLRSTTDVYILVDRTEEHIASPVTDEILQLFALQKDKWNGANFHLERLTDVSYNRISQCSLAEAEPLFSSTFTRDADVSAFTSTAIAALDSLAADTIGRPHSSVFIPMARALNTLSIAAGSSETRVLIVYSDLRENRSSLSFYDKHTLALLREDASNIESQLLTDMPLGDLTGITIHFVYEPKDEADDVTFRLIASFYEQLFVSRGATVLIGGSLTQ